MISFVSGVYDVDTIPPHQNKEYDLTELPISAESELELEEKLDIIFNLSGNEKQKYEHYVHKLANFKGDKDIPREVVAAPDFTEKRNQFIYDRLDGTPDRFIKSIANKHYKKIKQSSFTYTDAIQIGWVALIEAAKRFDYTRNVKYSTFAHRWVEGEISNALKRNAQTKIAEYEYDRDKFETSIEKEAFAIHKMEQLSEREREILNLYAEGYSTREIARQDNIEIEKSRIHEILKDIKKPNRTKRP